MISSSTTMNSFDLTCNSPSYSNSNLVIKLYVHQDDLIVSQFDLKYVSFISLIQITPDIITSTGSTTVSIELVNFYNSMYDSSVPKCVWILDDANVFYEDISLVSDDKIRCKSPDVSNESNLNSLRLAITNMDGSLSNELNIIVTDIPILTKQTPDNIIEGNMSYLFIQGSGFFSNSFLTVKISISSSEILKIPATFISETFISYQLFLTTANLFDGPLLISVSNNDQDYSNSISIEYYPHPYIGQISFTGSPFLGGNELVVYGNGYFDSLYCIFGDARVLATVDSYSELKCVTPYSKIGIAKFKLGLFDYEFEDKQTYFEFLGYVVYGVHPDQGKTTGGTEVTITGEYENILIQDASYQCIFGSVYVTASIINNRIVCTSPIGTGSVIVKLSINGIIYSNDDFSSNTFTYILYPTITTLSLSNGPSRGGSLVILNCNNCDSTFQ